MITIEVLKTVMFVAIYSTIKLSCVLSPILKHLMVEDTHFKILIFNEFIVLTNLLLTKLLFAKLHVLHVTG